MFALGGTRQPVDVSVSRVMAGWRECVQLMTIGEHRRAGSRKSWLQGPGRRPTGTVCSTSSSWNRQSPTIPPADVAERPRRQPQRKRLAYKFCARARASATPTGCGGSPCPTRLDDRRQDVDSSVVRGTPATLSLDDVVRGWTEGMQLMVEGERTRFWIPQDLGTKRGRIAQGDAGVRYRSNTDRVDTGSRLRAPGRIQSSELRSTKFGHPRQLP